MNDPTSYQPVRWSKPEPLSIGDSLSTELYLLKSRLHLNGQLIESDSTHLSRISKLTDDKTLVSSPISRLIRQRHERDSLRQAIRAIPSSRDTARIGYYITHAFRAKNKLGALVLDSVEFYIDKAGRVKMHG